MRSKLLLGVFCVAAFSLNAATEIVDGIEWTYVVSNGEASVGKVWSLDEFNFTDIYDISAIPITTSGLIEIPAKLGDYSVTSIGPLAFCACGSLTSVLIPNSVVNIGAYAFIGCALDSITMPSSITNIDNEAFIACNLSSVVIPQSICLQSLSSIISDVSMITNIVFTGSVTNIGNYAFRDCIGLTSMTIPDGVTSIGEYAFQGCSGLTSVTIPDSVTSIGEGAFLDCSSLVSVTIPDSITNIGSGAFAGCNSLVYMSIPNYTPRPIFTVEHGELISVVPDGATAVIPDGVTRIGSCAFLNYKGLMSVTIPNSVTNIGISAFQGCSGLTSVTIPNNVTSIMGSAFANTVLIFDSAPPSIAKNVLESCYFIYPEESAVAWKRLLGERFPEVIVHSKMRKNNPTLMDVDYIVHKDGVKGMQVKVRALAFEDGVRSFGKVVRPETFVNDTDGNPTVQNIGDNIDANVEHGLSWKVSSDWVTRLSKVKFEVLACDGALLPMETTIIPVSDRYGKMQISWNRHTNDQILDALMWLYADKAAGLTLENGALKAGGKTLANGTSLSDAAAAAEFVYRSMGFDGVLSGALLNYVNEETRLGLSPSGVRQYAYKFIEE